MVGEADEPIFYLLDYINNLKNYFTTSSCAGRITLMSIPENGKKKDAKFLYKTHYKTTGREVYNYLMEHYHKEKNIWFKMEPFILHVAAKSIKYAFKILKIAQTSGLKHSGIISKRNNIYFVEIQGSDRISTPVSKNGTIIINKEYIDVLVYEANKKLERVRNQIRKFYHNLILEFGY